jgi:hypothetical protein
MLYTGQKIRALRDKKNQYSNSRVKNKRTVSKKNNNREI